MDLVGCFVCDRRVHVGVHTVCRWRSAQPRSRCELWTFTNHELGLQLWHLAGKSTDHVTLRRRRGDRRSNCHDWVFAVHWLRIALGRTCHSERVRQEEGGQVDVEPEINPLA